MYTWNNKVLEKSWKYVLWEEIKTLQLFFSNVVLGASNFAQIFGYLEKWKVKDDIIMYVNLYPFTLKGLKVEKIADLWVTESVHWW